MRRNRVTLELTKQNVECQLMWVSLYDNVEKSNNDIAKLHTIMAKCPFRTQDNDIA